MNVAAPTAAAAPSRSRPGLPAGDRIVDEVSTYFRGEDWRRAVDVLHERDERIHHAHVYVDTNIHPLSLEEVVQAYFAKIGRPIARKIEIFTSGQDATKGTIHGIEPEGMPHFDLLWGYSEDVALRAARTGDTLESWGDGFMGRFIGQFPFRHPGASDEADMAAYFAGPIWRRFCAFVEDDAVVHAHANVEMSIHPDAVRDAALAVMREHGWDVEKAEHVAFKMRGQWQGKIVFMGWAPEKIFDIAWMYNPAVSLIPSTRYWLMTEYPEFDVRTMAEIPLMLKKNRYHTLSRNQIERIVDGF